MWKYRRRERTCQWSTMLLWPPRVTPLSMPGRTTSFFYKHGFCWSMYTSSHSSNHFTITSIQQSPPTQHHHQIQENHEHHHRQHILANAPGPLCRGGRSPGQDNRPILTCTCTCRSLQPISLAWSSVSATDRTRCCLENTCSTRTPLVGMAYLKFMCTKYTWINKYANAKTKKTKNHGLETGWVLTPWAMIFSVFSGVRPL